MRRSPISLSKKYIKLYGLPQSCPNCKSEKVRFDFGIYKCLSCGYRNDPRDNPEFLSRSRAIIRLENEKALDELFSSTGKEKLPELEDEPEPE